jgi:acyl-[acyl carrier protein]--UDP-N-acetylglucosamine O-acyltransferase
MQADAAAAPPHPHPPRAAQPDDARVVRYITAKNEDSSGAGAYSALKVAIEIGKRNREAERPRIGKGKRKEKYRGSRTRAVQGRGALERAAVKI